MADNPTMLSNATNGARTSRYGDIVMVVMETIAFVTTAQEYQAVSQWARAKQSLGNKHKDRAAMIGRFETLVGRSGGGCATRGTNKVLQGVVKSMEQSGFDIKDWILPPTLWESIEIKKKDKPEEDPAAAEASKPVEPGAAAP